MTSTLSSVVLWQMVRTESHPLSCGNGDCIVDNGDTLDGDVHYMLSRVREFSVGSSDTEEESEPDMTVIKAKQSRKMRHGSDKSYGWSPLLCTVDNAYLVPWLKILESYFLV